MPIDLRRSLPRLVVAALADVDCPCGTPPVVTNSLRRNGRVRAPCFPYGAAPNVL
jgi:hypothetical protein